MQPHPGAVVPLPPVPSPPALPPEPLPPPEPLGWQTSAPPGPLAQFPEQHDAEVVQAREMSTQPVAPPPAPPDPPAPPPVPAGWQMVVPAPVAQLPEQHDALLVQAKLFATHAVPPPPPTPRLLVWQYGSPPLNERHSSPIEQVGLLTLHSERQKPLMHLRPSWQDLIGFAPQVWSTPTF